MRFTKSIIITLIASLLAFKNYAQDNEALFNLSFGENIPNDIGLNGSFIGVHNNALIIAGGANFPETPVWEGGKKHWHGSIYVLEKDGNSSKWHQHENQKLTKAMAYGVSINTPNGVLCIGGDDEDEVFNDVFLLKWNATSKKIEIENLPPMPIALSSMGGSLIGDTVYLVGGKESSGGNATTNFLSFNLKATLSREIYTWEQLPNFPGEPRMQPVVIGQSNGHQDCLYVFSGMSYDKNANITHKMLDDVYQYDPHKILWTKKEAIPNNETPGVKGGYIAAAPAIKIGDSHIVIFGGAGGPNQHLSKRIQLWNEIKELKSVDALNKPIVKKIDSLNKLEKELVKSTSFSNTIWAYHTITDTWTKKGTLSGDTQVVTKAINWGNNIVIPGGEIHPGIRTNKIAQFNIKPYEASFGLANYITLIVYLTLMVLMGWYFSKRTKQQTISFLPADAFPGGRPD
jgi:cyclically-permuted mutarotase family protein